MRSVAAVVALVACLHAGAWAIWRSQAAAPNIEGVLNSVSYSPFLGHPDDPSYRPSEAQIRADLKAIAPFTKAIRLYKSTGGMEAVPAIANEFGLKVTLGIDLDYTKKPWKLGGKSETPEEERARNEAHNEREVVTAVELARHHRNVNGIMVGNETIFRGIYLNPDEIKEWIKKGHYASGWTAEHGGWEVKDLIRIIQRVKRDVDARVPVTTGEIHAEYSKHEELGFAVDYIAAHVLPYWNNVTYDQAVAQARDVYDHLRWEFKGKRVVLAEFGWPSGGYNRHDAVPGKLEQANVIRSFVAMARARGIEYNIIEAYDQPWKSMEGSVGMYWGLFDTNREPKFAWAGPITDSSPHANAAIAVVVGILVSLPILGLAGATLTQVLLLAAAAQVVGAWVATIFDYWYGHYFVFGTAFALGLGTVLLIPLVLIALWRIDEIADIVFGRKPSRLLAPAQAAADGAFAPKVSIHVPAYMEPPEMLKATLDAVARLNYPNFECIIVINNTPNPALWEPVEAHCQTLGERFRFLNAPKLEGYKAGALRLALAHTAADAEIIGVIDSDYAVTPDWLADLVPAFADHNVGMVQAPQDHRDGDKSPLHYAMNGEYAGFFDIGMIQRNEANAIITHGTMCLIRRTALEQAGGWSSDTICEDTDLGLTILELGWLTHYTNRRYGYGLLPDSFEAYKKQRDRWASGGFQIVKKHWRRFLPGASRLTGEQKREFAFGWINWLGAETVGVVVALLNLVLVPIVAFAGIAVPDSVLTLPVLATFAISIVHFVSLYRRRVPIAPSQAACAMVAAMAMQWTVARAVANGLIKEHLTFVRTAKGGAARRRRVVFPAFYEAVIGAALVAGAVIVFAENHDAVREINLFGFVLLVQSLPFTAAALLAAFESSPLNDFAVLQSASVRVRELWSRSLRARRAINQTVAAPEKQMEVVQ